MIKGFDISHNNNVEWDKISPEMKFVIIKASQGGSFHDPAFQTNWKIARDKGLYHGAYHFLNATDSGHAQADNFLNRGVNWTLPNVLPPFLDVEDQVPAELNAHITVNKQAFIDLVSDWIDIVEKETGRKVIIYSYNNFFKEYLNNHCWSNNKLWIASYQATLPPVPHGYKPEDLAFWQYSDRGRISGQPTGGEIDLDYFNGTIERLAKL